MKRLPTLCEFEMPVRVVEVLSTLNERSELGRVVINPPNKMPLLNFQETEESWFICRACGRSYLCKQKYLQHILEHKDETRIPPDQESESPSPLEELQNQNEYKVILQAPTRIRISLNPVVPNPEIQNIEIDATDSDESESTPTVPPEPESNQENFDPLTCPQCSKTFASLDSLKKHTKIHGEKRFKCSRCDNRFIFRYLMVDHFRDFHSKKNPFKCPKCTYRLTTNVSLRIHCRVHHNGTIDEVKAKARQDKILKHNSNSNSTGQQIESKLKSKLCLPQAPVKNKANSDGRFVCRFCKKVLTESRTLKEHLRLHTGEKPFSCKKCNMKFPRNSSLWSHVLTSHTYNNFKCKYCPCAFKCARSVTVHTRKFHPR